jgi:Domain of unknown function (DUF4116)
LPSAVFKPYIRISCAWSQIKQLDIMQTFPGFEIIPSIQQLLRRSYMSKKELVVALDTNNEKLTRKLNETHAFNKLPKEPLGLILQRLSLFDALSFSISSKFISEKLDTRYSNYLETALWKPLFEKYFPNASHNPKSYRKSLAYEYNLILKKVKNKPSKLKELNIALKKDKQFVLAAVEKSSWSLGYADDSLKKDKEVVFTAVKQDCWALMYADPSLLNDPVLTHIASILDDDKRKLICDFVTQDLNNLPVAQRVRDSRKSMQELSPQKATSLLKAISKTIKSDKTIESDIKKALKDTSSELYKALNKHSSPLGLTIFGKKHWISSKTRILQHIEVALENENSNTSELKNSFTFYL